MTQTLHNHLCIEDLPTMPIGTIAALPPQDLLQLHADVLARSDAARRLKDWFDGALALRYGGRAAEARREAGKDSGSVRLSDGPVTVIVDAPKRVEWDQASLARMAERIRASGENPADYLEITFSVPERRFSAWSPAMREGFAGARKLRTGRPTFRLTVTEQDQ